MYMLPKAFLRSCTHTYTKIKLKFTNTHRQNHIHTKKRETHKNTRHYIQTKAVSNWRESASISTVLYGKWTVRHTKSGQTCDHNRKTILIPLLIMFRMHITNRATEIDQKNTWVCSASNGKLLVMLRKWKSATRVTSSNPRVTISNSRVKSLNLRVTSLNPRVTRLKARVARLKAEFGWLKTRVRRLEARAEAIKPRVK